MASIKTTKAWTVQAKAGSDSLVFNERAPIRELTDCDVLVKFHAASLNFRDVLIPQGKYPLEIKDGVVPGSDGAGEVLAIGSRVTRFKKGDKVLTVFNPGHIDGSVSLKYLYTGLGSTNDGAFRQHGVFQEDGLVAMPSSLSWLEASTLSCAAVTAWNSLYGVKPLKAGQVVLTQGTGGVSIFALQFAKAAGAIVISTTSSKDKAKVLKELGADHVVNYKEVPDWGAKVKSLTPNGEGADNIVEVGGPSTLAQSFQATKIDGIISIVGFLDESGVEPPSFLEILGHSVNVRGVIVGSRAQFEDMNRAIEANKIKPVVDGKVFKLNELKQACQYLSEQKHIGKLCIEID